MKFGLLTSLTTVTLFGVLPIPVRLAAQNASSEIINFDAPGADKTADSGQGTFPDSISEAGAITGHYIDSNNVNHGSCAVPGATSSSRSMLPARARPQVRDRGPFLRASTRRGLSRDTTLIRTM